eukprot:g3588.t1
MVLRGVWKALLLQLLLLCHGAGSAKAAELRSCDDGLCRHSDFYHSGVYPSCSSSPLACQSVCGADLKRKANRTKILLVDAFDYPGYPDVGQTIIYPMLVDFVGADNVTYTTDKVDPPSLRELRVYTQIFFISLHACRTAGWPAAVAAWYKERRQIEGSGELIFDGRLYSSIWKTNTRPPNQKFLNNIVYNLQKRGGGLYIATDHNCCHSCVNELNEKLGISSFYGDHRGRGIVVDTDNPIFSVPFDATFPAIPSEVVEINGKVYDRVLYDDSTTGIAPANEQPGGDFLFPLAFHGGNINTPGISSTISGSLGLQVKIVSPTCDLCLDSDGIVTANVTSKTIGPYTFVWRLKEMNGQAWMSGLQSLDGAEISTIFINGTSSKLKSNRDYIMEVRCQDSQDAKVESRASIRFRYSCKVDCESEYLPWGICNETSGERHQKVKITVDRVGDGKPCLRPRTDNGRWGEWSNWGSRNEKRCGRGSTVESRSRLVIGSISPHDDEGFCKIGNETRQCDFGDYIYKERHLQILQSHMRSEG